jgi:hypothetical protein
MTAQPDIGFVKNNPMSFGKQPGGGKARNAAADDGDVQAPTGRQSGFDPVFPTIGSKVFVQRISLRASACQYLRGWLQNGSLEP